MKCTVCGNEKDFKPLYPSLCAAHNYLCEKCGLVFIPSEFQVTKNYYTDDGYYKESPNIAQRSFFYCPPFLIKLAKKRVGDMLNLLNLDIRGKKVLDVGCGYGELLYVLKNFYGAEVLGIEASKLAAETGKQLYDVEIISGAFEDLQLKDKFDLIITSGVLEHVQDPISFITKIKSHLNNTGIYYVDMQNILWPSGNSPLDHFLYDEHLHNFSSYTLELLLNKCGLYVTSYTDKTWLAMGSTAHKQLPKCKKISVDEIYEFLVKYKNTYSIFNYLKFYFDKVLYLINVLYYKIFGRLK